MYTGVSEATEGADESMDVDKNTENAENSNENGENTKFFRISLSPNDRYAPMTQMDVSSLLNGQKYHKPSSSDPSIRFADNSNELPKCRVSSISWGNENTIDIFKYQRC